MSTIKVELTDAELLLLDGKCSKDVQKHIDGILLSKELTHLDPEHAKFIVLVADEAKVNGQLVCYNIRISYCRLCKKNAGYYTFKKGRRKGCPDYAKPLTLAGVELAIRIVRVKNSASLGCCNECFEKLLPDLRKYLKDIRAEIPERLTGIPTKYKKWDLYECNRCTWKGKECDMGKLPAIIRGSYYGKCPQCAVENPPFGPFKIKRIDGFELVELNKDEL